MTAFCAICTADIAPTARARYFEGARVCDACCDEVVDATMPEHRQRGYQQPTDSATYKFGQQLNAAAARVIPERVRKLDEDFMHGVPVANGVLYDLAWRDGDLTAQQVKYQSRAQSRNRKQRKDSL